MHHELMTSHIREGFKEVGNMSYMLSCQVLRRGSSMIRMIETCSFQTA